MDGKIIGEWAVGPEEPAGRRHLQVVIEGVEAALFEYEVRKSVSAELPGPRLSGEYELPRMHGGIAGNAEQPNGKNQPCLGR